jgi:hypothetical protein
MSVKSPGLEERRGGGGASDNLPVKVNPSPGLFLGELSHNAWKALSPVVGGERVGGIFRGLFTQRAPSSVLFEEMTAIRAALLWFSHHPQFAPIFHTISKYAAHHVLTSCLSTGACRNCQRCLHFLGWDVDRVGGMDICESILLSAYAEVVHDPIYSMQLANKGISLIHQAINDMAAMPDVADRYHRLLARHLLSIKDKIFRMEDGILKWVASSEHKDTSISRGTTTTTNTTNIKNTGISAAVLEEILKEGGDIYNQIAAGKKMNASSWLYVGLPEILARIKAEGLQDEEKISKIISDVYLKWLHWGRESSQRRPEAGWPNANIATSPT